jgi:hypothetical protein
MFPVGSPAQGAFGHTGVLMVATAGAIVSGNYLVPALTPVGTVSGVIHDGWSRPPVGAIGVALANAAVASLIPAYVWGYGYMTGEVTQSAAQASRRERCRDRRFLGHHIRCHHARDGRRESPGGLDCRVARDQHDGLGDGLGRWH